MAHKNSGSSLKHSNPDRGPRMIEGAHHWDKGYVSDDEMTGGTYPEAHMRGNEYLHLQDTIRKRDRSKLERSKRHKIS